jgi:hypothetical protein
MLAISLVLELATKNILVAKENLGKILQIKLAKL